MIELGEDWVMGFSQLSVDIGKRQTTIDVKTGKPKIKWLWFFEDLDKALVGYGKLLKQRRLTEKDPETWEELLEVLRCTNEEIRELPNRLLPPSERR